MLFWVFSLKPINFPSFPTRVPVRPSAASICLANLSLSRCSSLVCSNNFAFWSVTNSCCSDTERFLTAWAICSSADWAISFSLPILASSTFSPLFNFSNSFCKISSISLLLSNVLVASLNSFDKSSPMLFVRDAWSFLD